MTGIGEIIRRRREKLGMSQGELAKRAGLSRTYVVMIETGKRQPSLKTAQRLFSSLGLSLQVETDAEEANHA